MITKCKILSGNLGTVGRRGKEREEILLRRGEMTLREIKGVKKIGNK